ncbi:hypothetical protein BU17DRAFT_76229 [Hysterangium stoloniferum]|nr:hypothetical protein BU17DRAFT_76229 [Hysterangium stoloniferum]
MPSHGRRHHGFLELSRWISIESGTHLVNQKAYLWRISGIVSGWQQLSVGTVKWWPCSSFDGVPGSECGFIITPLDYLNASAGVAKVALGRYKATTGPRKGMVMYNPGGPGGRGKPAATRRGPTFQALIGTDYDFVGFDPRGIGETEPSARCFEPGGYDLFRKKNSMLGRGFDAGPNLSDPATRNHMISQQQQAQGFYQAQFEVCARSRGDTLRFMGTTIVAKDIEFITRSLEGEHSLINFYGASYGTVIGAYLINMFPDRIGRVVLDGIVDAASWSNVPAYKWYRHWMAYTEDTYQSFLSDCSKAGPSLCPLAESKNENPSLIEKRIEDFYAQLYAKPMAVPDAKIPGILTSGSARIPIFATLVYPLTWRSTAMALNEAMHGNGTLLLNLAQTFFPNELERSAVSCNDNLAFAASVEDIVDELLGVLKTVTRFALSILTIEPDSGCNYWPVSPPERFQGPWNSTLKNQVLIHSNMLDPITPMSSGQRLKLNLGDSARIALREGVGHCSCSLPSLCTAKITRKYFEDGSLPPDGHVCGVDTSPFLDPPAMSNVLNEEDRELMKHLRILAKIFNHIVD